MEVNHLGMRVRRASECVAFYGARGEILRVRREVVIMNGLVHSTFDFQCRRRRRRRRTGAGSFRLRDVRKSIRVSAGGVGQRPREATVHAPPAAADKRIVGIHRRWVHPFAH